MTKVYIEYTICKRDEGRIKEHEVECSIQGSSVHLYSRQTNLDDIIIFLKPEIERIDERVYIIRPWKGKRVQSKLGKHFSRNGFYTEMPSEDDVKDFRETLERKLPSKTG
ncbi:hypothetical protein KY348_07755 [Candidatus Woesearchaeota archaeon]|nr:hypothetical protein [Candidatus Woesearchaeota archaeon]